MASRHDVEGEVYQRLYGPPDAPSAEAGVIGAEREPSGYDDHPEQGAEPPSGRWRGELFAAVAAARGALARRAAARHPGVVAPKPSVLRALALTALGVALLGIGILGAFVPDRPPDERVAGREPGPAKPGGARGEAAARAEARTRAERRRRARRRAEARADRRRAARRRAVARSSGAGARAPAATPSSGSAPTGSAGGPAPVVCTQGGACFTAAPRRQRAPRVVVRPSPETVVEQGPHGGESIGGPDLSGGRGARALDRRRDRSRPVAADQGRLAPELERARAGPPP